MNDATLEILLEQVRQQNYPLEVSADAADALVECIRRIMAAVPEDDRVFLRADYDLATSALCHPSPSTNGIG
jgi:hypothetical protein